MNFSIKTFTTESGTSPCLAFTTDKLKIVSSKECRDGQGLVCVCVSHHAAAGLPPGTCQYWIFGCVSSCHFPPNIHKEKSSKRIKCQGINGSDSWGCFSRFRQFHPKLCFRNAEKLNAETNSRSRAISVSSDAGALTQPLGETKDAGGKRRKEIASVYQLLMQWTD